MPFNVQDNLQEYIPLLCFFCCSNTYNEATIYLICSLPTLTVTIHNHYLQVARVKVHLICYLTDGTSIRKSPHSIPQYSVEHFKLF